MQHPFSIFSARHLNGFDSLSQDYQYGTVSSGGKAMSAIVVDSDMHNWHIVNTKHSSGQYTAVAVLGAFDSAEAQAIVQSSNPSLTLLKDVAQSHTAGLKRYLESNFYHPFTRPVFVDEMDSLQSVTLGQKVVFDDANRPISHGGYKGLLLDLIKHDDNQDLIGEYDSLALDDVELYDGLIVEKAKLASTLSRLTTALSNAGTILKVTNLVQSKPVTLKSTGAIQVTASYELSDGQKLHIVFNHTSEEAVKLGVKDSLFAWKYKLNGADITLSVQPKATENVALPKLASRMMKLAEANSERFVLAQEKKAANKQALEDSVNRIAEKQQRNDAIKLEIADLQKQIDEWQPVGGVEPTEPQNLKRKDDKTAKDYDYLKQVIKDAVAKYFPNTNSKDGFSLDQEGAYNMVYHTFMHALAGNGFSLQDIRKRIQSSDRSSRLYRAVLQSVVGQNIPKNKKDDEVLSIFDKWVNDTFEPTENEVQPVNEHQADIDYLNSIINGQQDPLDADMDRIIAIGKRDEEDPLFLQALDVTSKAEDEATA